MTIEDVLAISRDAGPVVGGALLFLWAVVRLNGGIGAVKMRDDTTAAIEAMTRRVQYLEAKNEALEGMVNKHESQIAVLNDRWDRKGD